MKEVQESSRNQVGFGLVNIVLSFVQKGKKGKAVLGAGSRGANREFGFRHIKFGVPLRYPSGDVN